MRSTHNNSPCPVSHNYFFSGIGSYWDPPLNEIKVVPLHPDSTEYQIVVGDYMSTIDVRFHGGVKSRITAADIEILEVRPNRVHHPASCADIS